MILCAAMKIESEIGHDTPGSSGRKPGRQPATEAICELESAVPVTKGGPGYPRGGKARLSSLTNKGRGKVAHDDLASEADNLTMHQHLLGDSNISGGKHLCGCPIQ